jgi:succinate dehydrogenase hydrophobic anchor subunit
MRILSLCLIFLIILSFVFAEEDGFQKIQDEVFRILRNIIMFLFSALMLLSGLVLLFLGVKYIFAKGDVKELHKMLLYVVLGIILLASSFFVPNLLKNLIEGLRS